MAGVGQLEVEAQLRDAVGRGLRDELERMFTWFSESTPATSRSRRDRSSASTSTDTTNVAGWSWSHSTSMKRWVCAESASAFAQSVRCTDTPRPRVTKPMISSPGTGVQHRDKPHHDVVEALDVHADGAAPLGTRRARRAVRGDRQLLLAAEQLALDALRDGLRADVTLADRGVQRVDVGVVERLGRGG